MFARRFAIIGGFIGIHSTATRYIRPVLVLPWLFFIMTSDWQCVCWEGGSIYCHRSIPPTCKSRRTSWVKNDLSLKSLNAYNQVTQMTETLEWPVSRSVFWHPLTQDSLGICKKHYGLLFMIQTDNYVLHILRSVGILYRVWNVVREYENKLITPWIKTN